jgi:hypothetical protein
MAKLEKKSVKAFSCPCNIGTEYKGEFAGTRAGLSQQKLETPWIRARGSKMLLTDERL